MGSGAYSYYDRALRSHDMGYTTKSPTEIFKQRSVNNAMDPNGVEIRESRDSEEHPLSLALFLALDVTGSMGSIPHYLVKEGLPEIMKGIMDSGINDTQVLFTGIGDHECDRSPLQIGQFESSDKLLDHWLTSLWIESGGGGNAGESYLLAWYFAWKHTSIDCFEKRGQKGILITIGDEPTLKCLPKRSLENIMGPGQCETYEDVFLLDKAREKYEVYHIHMKQGTNGRRQSVMDGWMQLIGKDNLIIIEKKEDVVQSIINVVNKSISNNIVEVNKIKNDIKENNDDMIL